MKRNFDCRVSSGHMGLSRWRASGLVIAMFVAACGSQSTSSSDGGLHGDGSGLPDARSDVGTPDDGSLPDGGTEDGGHQGDAGVETLTYDLVVVGAGSGGISAAIQAARMGARVALLEETDWVGGQMAAAAVSFGDWYLRAPAGTGLYAEFVDRVRAYYGDAVRFPPSGKPIGTCYFGTGNQCWEPHVGRQILEQMLTGAGVDLYLRTTVTSALRSGTLVTGVDTDKGRRFVCSVLIDATECGDVIPLTGARYRIGRSSSDSIDHSACIQDITYVAVIRRYFQGVPADLRITAPPPGYGTLGEEFATMVSTDGDDTADWDIHYPVNWAVHNAYRGMPDSKNPVAYDSDSFEEISRTGANWANDYPGHFMEQVGGSTQKHWRGKMTVDYIEDRTVRREKNCEAKLISLSFLYYAQHPLGAADWSLADDEGYDTPYNIQDNDCPNIPAELKPLERLLPVMPYVRESRRIEALRMLTTADLERGQDPLDPAIHNVSSAIAVGDYGTDLHNCHDTEDLDFGETWPESHTPEGGAFQVPMETLIPETVDGFLAAEKKHRHIPAGRRCHPAAAHHHGHRPGSRRIGSRSHPPGCPTSTGKPSGRAGGTAGFRLFPGAVRVPRRPRRRSRLGFRPARKCLRHHAAHDRPRAFQPGSGSAARGRSNDPGPPVRTRCKQSSCHSFLYRRHARRLSRRVSLCGGLLPGRLHLGLLCLSPQILPHPPHDAGPDGSLPRQGPGPGSRHGTLRALVR